MSLELHDSESESHGGKIFAYLGAANALLYRSIIHVFVESKKRFLVPLRSQDVFDAVRASAVIGVAGDAEIDAALEQLCKWGNLQASPDPANIRNSNECDNRQKAFRLTLQGEAAARAFAVFERGCEDLSALHGPAAFTDIVHVVRELGQFSRQAELDPGAVHRNFLLLKARFEDLAANAHTVIDRLERTDGVPVSEIRRLVDYGERFVGELVMTADRVGEAVHDIETVGTERLLRAAAEHDLRDGLHNTPETVAAVSARWRSHWEFFCAWFVSVPGRLSNAELLRERVRSAIPALLRVITSANDRQVYRIDRSNDFRVLARWFAQAESDAEAHRFWRALFGLCPARHLMVNDETLGNYEIANVTENTSWLNSPPVRFSIRIRDHGNTAQPALSRMIDRTVEKEKLAAAVRDESLRTLTVQSRFAAGRRTRLSELECWDPGEFDVFLELLSEALSARVFPDAPVEITSGDGCLRVKLEPTGDGREALVVTREGIFSGPDHWITVEQIPVEEVLV